MQTYIKNNQGYVDNSSYLCGLSLGRSTEGAKHGEFRGNNKFGH